MAEEINDSSEIISSATDEELSVVIDNKENSEKEKIYHTNLNIGEKEKEKNCKTMEPIKNATLLSNTFQFKNFVPIREKCHHYTIYAKVNWNEFSGDILEFYEGHIPYDAMHGDIITTPEKNLRSMEVYFVNVDLAETLVNPNEEKNLKSKNKFKIERHLCQEDLGGSGFCCVPLIVTRKIADPIKFYENAFTFDNYDEIDFSGIEIDTVIHQELIQRYTGGKYVHPNRKCFYFFEFNEWDSKAGMFIWCDFFLDDFDAGRYLLLTPDIDESYLDENPAKIRDPQLFKSSIEMKTKYEIKFTKTFLSMQLKDEVEIYGLTFFVPQNNQPNGGNMLSMHFKRIETTIIDGSNESISAIILTYFNDSQKNKEPSLLEEEFRFTQKTYTEYGRYGNVKLWSIENASIIPGEEPHTYIICNSELFY